MHHSPLRMSRALTASLLATGVVFAFLGVVMGDPHIPVAIAPDVDRGPGVEVATFALG